jgi:hypothetical protein
MRKEKMRGGRTKGRRQRADRGAAKSENRGRRSGSLLPPVHLDVAAEPLGPPRGGDASYDFQARRRKPHSTAPPPRRSRAAGRKGPARHMRTARREAVQEHVSEEVALACCARSEGDEASGASLRDGPEVDEARCCVVDNTIG